MSSLTGRPIRALLILAAALFLYAPPGPLLRESGAYGQSGTAPHLGDALEVSIDALYRFPGEPGCNVHVNWVGKIWFTQPEVKGGGWSFVGASNEPLPFTNFPGGGAKNRATLDPGAPPVQLTAEGDCGVWQDPQIGVRFYEVWATESDSGPLHHQVRFEALVTGPGIPIGSSDDPDLFSVDESEFEKANVSPKGFRHTFTYSATDESEPLVSASVVIGPKPFLRIIEPKPEARLVYGLDESGQRAQSGSITFKAKAKAPPEIAPQITWELGPIAGSSVTIEPQKGSEVRITITGMPKKIPSSARRL